MLDDLRLLASKKPADRTTAASRLSTTLLSDAGAAAEATTALIEMALAKATPDRHRILALLADLSAGGHARLLETGDFGPLEATPKKGGNTSSPRAAAAAQEKEWRTLLGNTDKGLRAAAAMLLALTSSKPVDAANAVATAFLKEKDDAVKASELLALGVLDARGKTIEHAGLMALHAGDDPRLPKAPSPLVAVAAIVALGYAQPLAVSAPMLERLRKNARLEAPADKLPWFGGKLGSLAKARLSALEKVDVAAWIRGLDALIAAHRPKRGEHDPVVTRQWDTLVERLCAPFQGREGDEVLPEELSDDQRKLLVEGYKRGLSRVFVKLGLGWMDDPDTSHGAAWSAGRFLGVVPAGPLDRPVTIEGKSAPWWKVFVRLARKETPVAPIKKALESLSETELLDLAVDVTERAYRPSWDEGVMKRSARAAVLLEELDRRGLTTAAHEPVRVVLDALANARIGLLKGWHNGPFVPKKKQSK